MRKIDRQISIIIPTYNSWNTLKPCLVSLSQQTLQPKEILVVNNASADDTAVNIRRQFPKVHLITLSQNTGVTGGRNVGIKRADRKSDYLLFFDHDMVADKSMLENLISAAEVNKAYGIITPKIYFLKNKTTIWSAGTNINLWTGQIVFRGGEDTGQFDKVQEVQVAPAAILVKKDVLDKVKRFDDIYFATFEDTDFCFRAKESGFKTIYTPDAIAYHDILPDAKYTASRLISRAYWVGRNRVIFMRRFANSFLLFLFISPLYLLYFIYLSIKMRSLQGLIGYLKGYLVGLRVVFLREHKLWHKVH